MNDILFKSDIRSTVQIEGCPHRNKRNASVSPLVGMLIAALYLSIWIMPNPQAMWIACGLLYFLWLLFLNQGSRELKKYLFYVGSSLLNTQLIIILSYKLARVVGHSHHILLFYGKYIPEDICKKMALIVFCEMPNRFQYMRCKGCPVWITLI